MERPLSNDLRDRLVSAVDGGLSRRSAAKHFGVAPSTAIKWVDRWHRTGDVGPRRQGGDQRSRQIEVHAEEILTLIEAALEHFRFILVHIHRRRSSFGILGY